MRIHHSVTDTQGNIAYRNVSCCCASWKMCDCNELKHSFPVCTVRVADSPALTEVELPGGNNSLIDESSSSVAVSVAGVGDHDIPLLAISCIHKHLRSASSQPGCYTVLDFYSLTTSASFSFDRRVRCC